MATKKITITVPEELLKAARELTANVSGYAAEALADRIRHDLLGEELQRYQDEYGAFTEEEMAAADALLCGTSEPTSHAQANAA